MAMYPMRKNRMESIAGKRGLLSVTFFCGSVSEDAAAFVFDDILPRRRFCCCIEEVLTSIKLVERVVVLIV